MSETTKQTSKREESAPLKEYRLGNGLCLILISLQTLLTESIIKLFLVPSRNAVTIKKLLNQKLTIKQFLQYLVSKRNFSVKKYSNEKYICQFTNRKKKIIYLFKGYLITSSKNKCPKCNRVFLMNHTCETDFCNNQPYLNVRPPRLFEYPLIVDIILDIECAFINDFHVPVLLCICYKLYGILKQKSFLTIESFFKWLHKFVDLYMPDGSRVNLIGFNSSRYDFIFFIKETRKYVSNYWSFQKDVYNYMQKDGAIIYNTFNIGKCSVWFIDILRYTGGVTSLKQIAKDLNIELSKGAFPFEILARNDFKLDLDGFPHQKYFNSEEQYIISKDMWIKKNKCSFFDLLKYYCMLDVKITLEVWEKICKMYNDYVPYMKNVHITQFHGAPSLTKWVSLKMALDNENLKTVVNYSNGTGSNKNKNKNIKLYAPNYDSYTMWEKSIYGGWVGCHWMGIIKENLGMVDIVSHYPTSFTSYYGVFKPRSLTDEECLKFSSNISDYNLNTLPLFVAKVEVIPPKTISDFCSPLPQRCKVGILTWSYLPCTQYLNSIDIWLCDKYGFKFKILYGEIFSKKALLFKSFVECFAKMKDDGKKEKNELKTKCGKIGLNSGIGKYGEKKERILSKIVKNEEDLEELSLLLNTNSNHCYHELMDIVVHEDYEEYVIKEYDITCNKIPIHVISCMFAYSRVIKMDLISRCKLDNYDIFNPLVKYPTPIYGDTDSIVILKSQLIKLKKDSPALFQSSIGFFNTSTAEFDYHIETEDLFKGDTIPDTKIAIFFGLKAYMIITDKGSKLKCKGHRIAQVNEMCDCNSGSKKWFCVACLDNNFQTKKTINCDGVSLQHFYNSVYGQKHSFCYQRFEKVLNRPSKGKQPFTIKNKSVNIRLNYTMLEHKYSYNPYTNMCYPFTVKDLIDE